MSIIWVKKWTESFKDDYHAGQRPNDRTTNRPHRKQCPSLRLHPHINKCYLIEMGLWFKGKCGGASAMATDQGTDQPKQKHTEYDKRVFVAWDELAHSTIRDIWLHK
jgi:hypothetical protein